MLHGHKFDLFGEVFCFVCLDCTNSFLPLASKSKIDQLIKLINLAVTVHLEDFVFIKFSFV